MCLSFGKQFGVNVLAAEGMWPKSPLAWLCAQPAQQAISSFCALCSPTRASDVSRRCVEDEVLVRQHSTSGVVAVTCRMRATGRPTQPIADRIRVLHYS